jgi:hypothetical protein
LGQEPSWFPLQKENDRDQDHNFSEHGRAQHLLKNLVRTADANRRDHGTGNAPHSANDDRHEAVDNITLPQTGADVPDLREERSRQSGQAGRESEGEHIDALSWHTHASGHVAVLNRGPDEQTERRFS